MPVSVYSEFGLDFLGGSNFEGSLFGFEIQAYDSVGSRFGIIRFVPSLNSTDENTRPGLFLKCLNLFMHDPYFLTWIIRTDFLGDFVQFHAVYTKNIHKLEDFLGHIDVCICILKR